MTCFLSPTESVCICVQCFSFQEWCNTAQNCLNLADEEVCRPNVQELFNDINIRVANFTWAVKQVLPPAEVNFFDWQYGLPYITPLSEPEDFSPGVASQLSMMTCPETHFQCPGGGYCLPVYVLCNGVDDCVGREDEANCETFACPGFYRCRGSRLCLHPNQLCDAVFQCPQQDDEKFCDLACPENCSCHGLSFQCREALDVDAYANMRYLDASESGLDPGLLLRGTMLIFLNLQRCGISGLTLPKLPNLCILDVSHNNIHAVTVDDLRKVSKLKILVMTGNPLFSLFESNFSSSGETLPRLEVLDLAMVATRHINTLIFTSFPVLTKLNLSSSSVQQVSGALPTQRLRVLDLGGMEVSQFPEDLLKDLSNLDFVVANDYKVCCPQMLPRGVDRKDCDGPEPVISSCYNLLGSKLRQAFVSALTALALGGNTANLAVARLIASPAVDKGCSDRTLLLVSHLSVSNFVMGCYLALVSVADRLYSGVYLWKDWHWRSSPWCTLSSFLFVLSSQVSAFLAVCITLERCVALARTERVSTSRRVVHRACGVCWIVGVVFATLSVVTQGTLTSKTGLCLPLALTPWESSQRRGDASSAFTTLNMLLMSFTGAGQTYVYIAIRRNTMALLVDSQTTRDLTVARRFVNVAAAGVCSWLLVGFFTAKWAEAEWVRADVVSSVVAFVIPFSSALQPVLYMANIVLERRRYTQMQRLLKRLGSGVNKRKLKGKASKSQ